MKKKSVLLAMVYLQKELPNIDLMESISNSDLTENICRNGREALWYFDGFDNLAIYIDTLDFLTEEEIEKELL